MAFLSSSPLQFISSIPPVTRAFTAATVVSSLLYYFLSWSGGPDFQGAYLVLIPGSSIFYPWTFVTSALVEVTIFELVFSLIVIPPSLRYLERLWGAVETLKFIVVSVGVSNLIAFVLNWLEYLVLRNPLFLYAHQYHGQMALQIAVLVAFTQVIPEHQVQVFGVFKARVKTIPMAYVTFSTIMCILGFQCPYIVIQFGWLVSYIWLRFYKKNTDTLGAPAYGDRSETFAFVNWFPPLIHGPISSLANFAHSLATKFRVIPSSGSEGESVVYTPVPGSARAEAERRRAMALKALDQRLAGGASPSPRNTSVSSSGPSGLRPPSVVENHQPNPGPAEGGKDASSAV